MNLQDGLNVISGATSSNYLSRLGNSINQNVFGSQITNTYGKQTSVFIDGVRLWEETTAFQASATDPTTLQLNFIPTPTSTGLEWLQKIASFGGLDLGLIGRSVAENPFMGNAWGGGISLNVGDLATLNYKGSQLSVNRAVNQMEYSPGSGVGNASSIVGIESQLQTFFKVIWGTVLISSLVFAEYSVTVAVDQDLAQNEEWQMANLALELAQILVLYLVVNYEDSFTTKLTNQEFLASNIAEDSVSADQLESAIKDLEQKLSAKIDALTKVVTDNQVSTVAQFKSLIDTTAQLQTQLQTNLVASQQAYAEFLQSNADNLALQVATMQRTVEFQNRIASVLGGASTDAYATALARFQSQAASALALAQSYQARGQAVQEQVEQMVNLSVPPTNLTAGPEAGTTAMTFQDDSSINDPSFVDHSAASSSNSAIQQATIDADSAQKMELLDAFTDITGEQIDTIGLELAAVVNNANKLGDKELQLQAGSWWGATKRLFTTGSSAKLPTSPTAKWVLVNAASGATQGQTPP